MNAVEHGLEPLEPPHSPEVAELLARYPQRRGYVLKLFRVFANSVRFLRKGTANLLDADSPLPLRLRELVILRVCANNDCEYEWGVHVAAFGAHAGFTDAQIRATRLDPPDAECWTAVERLALQAVDELCSSGRVLDATYRRFAATWTAEQQLEILALAGNYHTICFVASTARVTPESFAAAFPD